jgi:hypothetical protein
MPQVQEYKVSLLLKNDHVRVTKVEISLGGTIPRHSHRHGYTVVPNVSGRIRKTTYRGDRVEKQEDIELVLDKPYWVEAQGADIETEVLNIGEGVVIFTKLKCCPSGTC